MFLFKERHRHLYLFCFLIFVSCLCVSTNAQPIDEQATPEFTSPPSVISDSGHTRLDWTLSKDVLQTQFPIFELQQSKASDFSNSIVRYQGPDTASFISGLPNGVYHFRVRSHFSAEQISNWSKPVVVEVQHHSLLLAYILFAIGLIVFAATVYVVVSGTRNTQTID